MQMGVYFFPQVYASPRFLIHMLNGLLSPNITIICANISDLFVKLEDFEGLLTLHALQGKSNQSRLKIAFLIAEKEFGIYPLLDPEDVDVSNPDEKSVMTYVAQFLNKFSSKVCMQIFLHSIRFPDSLNPFFYDTLCNEDTYM